MSDGRYDEREPSFGNDESQPELATQEDIESISLDSEPRPYRSGSARRSSSRPRRGRKKRLWPWLVFFILITCGLGYGGYVSYHSYMQGHVSLDHLSSLGMDQSKGVQAFIEPNKETQELSEANLRWCLRQKVRLDTLDKLVTSNLEIARINLMREDMTNLCDFSLASENLVGEVALQLEQLHESIIAETIDNQLLYIGSVEGSKWTASQMVSETQRLLDSLGYQTGPIDGKLGRQTMIAVKAFQRDYELEPTGQPSQELLARLRRAMQEK